MQLIDYLTDEDLKTIQDWIEINKNCVVTNVKDVLAYWNKNNRTLFKLLGNKLRVKIPVEIKVDKSVLSRRMEELYVRPLFCSSDKKLYIEEMNHDFFIDLLENYILPLGWSPDETYYWYTSDFKCSVFQMQGEHNSCKLNTIAALESFFSQVPIVEGEIAYTYTVIYKDKKPLILPKGMKYMRAMQKFLKYIEYPNMYLFEKFRNEVSDICTATRIKANLVLSIHPIDFLTLSDNNCGWRSCVSMEKKHKGGFHLGLTEMLNSNCMLIAYLESEHKKFTFNFHDIPNKSWRQLFVCHKDIICSSKSYPYKSEMLTKRVLNILRSMAENNLNWTYNHGPQLYKDIHCYENQDIHEYSYRDGHKIIFYTRGYYNDMVSDRGYDYWCVRKYVDKTKFISLSGPATCFMCGEPLLEPDTIHGTNTRWFHERFIDEYGRGLCEKCNAHHCESCRKTNRITPMYRIRHDNGYATVVCESCLKDWCFKIKRTQLIKNGNMIYDVNKFFKHKGQCDKEDGWLPVIDGDMNYAKEFEI